MAKIERFTGSRSGPTIHDRDELVIFVARLLELAKKGEFDAMGYFTVDADHATCLNFIKLPGISANDLVASAAYLAADLVNDVIQAGQVVDES